MSADGLASPVDDPAVDALRRGVGLAREDEVLRALRVSGEHAFELLDAVSPRALFVRDGQMLPTAFLRDDGTVYADVLICADDLDFVLLAEGPSGAELVDWLTSHADPSWEVSVEDLGPTHRILGLHGPYAWELLAELAGPEVVGVGYLRHFQLFEHGTTVFRAGSTGEFGYLLLVPVERADGLQSDLRRAGLAFDLVDLPRDTLDLAALETGFLCMRSGAAAWPADELQLLWRVAWDRQAPGLDALRARRGRVDHRVVWFTAATDPSAEHGVCDARWSPALGRYVGRARLPASHADPGAVHGPLTVVAPPLLQNRSLFVDAQRHSFAGRDLDAFPPLVP